MPELADDPDAQRVEHLEACPTCAARMGRQRALRAGLRAVAGELRRVEAPARVEARLLAAFRGYSGLPAGGSRRRWWAPVLTWACAGAAVAALALFLVRDRQPAPRRSTPATLQLAAMDIATDSGLANLDDEFIPLPNAAQIGPNEDWNLVRLEVPRSALIAMGFMMSAEGASETVEADVVLGPDGLARAVRFVD